MTDILQSHMTAGTDSASPDVRRSVWPYAGLMAAVCWFVWPAFNAQGHRTFVDRDVDPTTSFIYDSMSSTLTGRLGGGIALLGVLAALVFLVGFSRWVDTRLSDRVSWRETLRWASIAFISTSCVGAVMHYVAAGGAPDGGDRALYTHEASTTIAVLADQLAYASAVPSLAVMAVVGVLALRDRLLPRVVGGLVMLLAVGSVGATVVLGLPYSSSLVWPLFAAVTSIAVLLRRTS